MGLRRIIGCLGLDRYKENHTKRIIAARISDRMGYRGISRIYLASKCEVDIERVDLWLSGVYTISEEELELIENILGPINRL